MKRVRCANSSCEAQGNAPPARMSLCESNQGPEINWKRVGERELQSEKQQ